MRSSFAAALMGIGGIFLAFAVVVFVLEILASRSDSEHKLATMSALAVTSLMAGAILIILGVCKLGARASGWSFTCMASRLSFGSRLGPLGTAQLKSTPLSSSRKS